MEKQLLSIIEQVERLDWNIVMAERAINNEWIVMSRRNNSTFENLEYVVHNFYIESECLFNGFYDLSLSDACKVFNDRVKILKERE